MLMNESAGFGDLDYALDALGTLDGRKRKGGLIGKRLAIGKKILRYATPPGLLFTAAKYGRKKLVKRRKKKADGREVDEVVDAETGEMMEELPAGEPVPGEVPPPSAPPAAPYAPTAPGALLPAPAPYAEEAPAEEPVPEVAPTATGPVREAPAPAEAPEAEEAEDEEEGEEGEAKAPPPKAVPAVPAKPAEGPVPLKAAPAIGPGTSWMPLLVIGGGLALGAAIYFMRKKKTAAPAGAR